MNRLMAILPAFIGLVLAAEPGRAAEKVAVRLGDITISYDPARWRGVDEKAVPLSVHDRTKRQSIRYFSCIAPECPDEPVVWASARPLADAGQDKPASGFEAWHTGVRPMPGLPPAGKDFGGLTLTGRILLSGCRARTPIERLASGSSGAFVYTFGSGANVGCSGVEGVPEEMFLELLGGISVEPEPKR